MAFFKRKNEPALPSGDNSEQIIASVIGALSALVGGTYKDDENGLASVANSNKETISDEIKIKFVRSTSHKNCICVNIQQETYGSFTILLC